MLPIKERAYYAQKQRECRQRNADNLEYKARKRATDKVYYEKNRSKISFQRKIKYAENPEPTRERARSYYRSNLKKVKDYRERNRERRIEQTKRWKVANQDSVRRYRAKYYSENREKGKKYSREYYIAHAQEQIEKSRKWRAKNPEKLFEMGKRYRDNNKEKLYIKNAKRRAFLKNVMVEDINPEEIYIRDRGICGICGLFVERKVVTLDHIIPLSLGGSHTATNLQIAHRSCNSRKGIKLMDEMKGRELFAFH